MSQQNHEQGSESSRVSNPAIRGLNDRYAGKITSGEIQVTASSRDKLSPSQQFDLRMREKKLLLAGKEKQALQQKLDSVNCSIQAIQSYDYSKASPNSSPSRVNAALDPTQLLRRNQQFRARLKEQRRKLSEKKQARSAKEEQKHRQIEQARVAAMQAEKGRKKQQILKNMERIKARMDTREEQLRRRQEEYHRVIGGSTLFRKIQRQQALHDSSVLQQRKKKLANIRNLHKPVTMDEIEDHQRKFYEALREKQEMRQRQRRLSNAADQYRVSYKSPYHKSFVCSGEEEEEANSKIKADKMKQFAEHVRQNFQPQVDNRKRELLEKQLEDQIQRQRRREARDEEDQQRAEEVRSKGLRYLQELRELPKRKKGSPVSPPKTDRVTYKNYLTHSENIGKAKWGSILESKGSRKDKAIRLQMEAERMEGSLKMKEQRARLLKKDHDAVDDEYYQMVKAKLQLLQI